MQTLLLPLILFARTDTNRAMRDGVLRAAVLLVRLAPPVPRFHRGTRGGYKENLGQAHSLRTGAPRCSMLAYFPTKLPPVPAASRVHVKACSLSHTRCVVDLDLSTPMRQPVEGESARWLAVATMATMATP